MAGNPYCKQIDVFVGHNIRDQRSLQNYTQEWLANKLGISYQQVQKYETGMNRVSSGRLYEIAKILSVSIDALYRGAETVPGAPPPSTGDQTPEILSLIGDFQTLDSGTVRSAISGVVKAIAKGDPIDEAPP